MKLTKEAIEKKYEYRIIENHLKNYRNYLAGIRNMQKQIDYSLPKITANYDLREESIGTFMFSSSTERFAIDRIESSSALKLHEDIVIYELIVNSIDEAIAELAEEEREFVELRYFNGYTIMGTAEEMGYSERQVYLIRNNVRDQLLISLKNIIMLNI